jgi:lambda family phage tail tape measure protein
MAMNLDAALKITANVIGENNIRKLGNSLQGLEGRLKNTSQAASLLVTGIKGLAAAAVTGGVIALAKSAIDLADDMRDLSQRTGVSIQTLGQFKIAAELSGSSLEGVAKGLTFLNKNLVAAATGTESAAAAFKTIGVATTDAQGNLRSADKVFLDIADRFATLRDGPEKAALAIKVFGKAGAELIPILNLGSQEIQRFGLNIGPDFANKADAFNDQLGLMGAQTTMLTIEIGSKLLPVMSGLLSIVSESIAAMGNLAKEFYAAVGGAAGLQQAAATLIKTMVVLGGVTAGVFLATNITTFATALRGVVGVMRTMLTLERAMLAIETARVAVAGLIAGIKSGKTPVTAIVGGAIGGTLAAGALGLGISKLIDGITQKITAGLGGAFKGISIPESTAAAGTIPNLSGLQTEKKAKKTKEITEITAQELQYSLLLNRAKIDGNELQQAEAEYALTLLDIDKQKLGVNKRQKLEADATTKLFQTQIDYAKQVGAAVAQDFLKRQELQNNYNQTIEDLKIKAGLITGEGLKKIQIDRELATIIERMPGLTDTQIAKLKELIQASQDVKKSFKETFGESLKQYYEQLTNLGTQVADSVKGAFQGLEDQLVNFVTTGKANFADLAKSIIADIARIAIRQAIIAPLVKGVGSIFGLQFADGGVFAQNGIQKFAMGGVVNRPTIFPFANGTGLMGEAGPEAIMPLQRGANGKLGVIASGGGNTSVVVNVDASGNANVQGDQAQAKQLGVVVSAAVQAELVKQQRPGGLLAGTRR